jgi:hypothetical protein
VAETVERWVTSGEGATLAGVTRSGFRTLVARATRAGVDVRAPRAAWPDGRTPLFDRELVEEYLRNRPGRGRRIDR